MIPPWVVNTGWGLSALAEAGRFRAAQKRVAAEQKRLLLAMVRANAETAYGRAHGFPRIRTVADFQRQTPLVDYDDLAPYIERIAAGERHVLTREPVRLFEPTSGSTAATKLIPVTASLKRQFSRGIAPWIADLFAHRPGLMGGPAYWSVSPVDPARRVTAGGIPIGFEDDTDYLGRGGRWLRAILAVPPAVKRLADVDAFRYVTLLFLLRSPDMRLVSVWNPTFLTILLGYLEPWGGGLVRDLAGGTLSPPGEVDPAVLSDISAAAPARLTPNPRRAAVLARALALSPAARHRLLWPRLGLVSCWADGPARAPAADLAALLPHAHLQPKGLIATEAFVSLPLLGRPGATLAVRAHFFEFVSGAGDIHLAHELVQGARYEVVVTTGGGLFRYRLGDVVESLGGLAIRFLGRAGRVADRFGEKVSEGHVRRIFESLFDEPPLLAVLSPETNAAGVTAYTLFATVPAAAELLEARLCENYHYAYCRRLGQLDAARVVLVGDDAPERYLQAGLAGGRRLGDIKPVALYPQGGLMAYLVG